MQEPAASWQSISRRLGVVESRIAISQLCSEYCFCVDERNLDGVIGLFTPDAAVAIPSFKAEARGRSALRELYQGLIGALSTSYHWTHDHVVRFCNSDSNRASGRLAAHAEVGLSGNTYVVGVRYEDVYRCADQQWLIESRKILFMYYSPVAEFQNRFVRRDRIATTEGWVTTDYCAPV